MRAASQGGLPGCGPTCSVLQLETELQLDADALLGLLRRTRAVESGPRRQAEQRSTKLITESYPDRKIIVFSQFADTVRYLERELQSRGVGALAGVTGDSPDPTAMAWRFSPVSNDRLGNVAKDRELRVLVATDVLSEGQNLQDCAIVVNYDLPWAIIRLIQRAGRVDRIGQGAEEILCHSFMPADGVERIIRLRNRVREQAPRERRGHRHRRRVLRGRPGRPAHHQPLQRAGWHPGRRRRRRN